MLKLRLVEIENFACFENLSLEPSVDPERPLTIVRAENGSGKTTLLRAIRWGMYGEGGLPGAVPARFSLHPAWWVPDADGIRTQVSLEFETDGSTRHTEQGGKNTVYRLVRSVLTVGQATESDDEPDFRRISESAQLMVREADGRWSPHTAGVEVVIEELLPRGLRDFFVMDADEATDFVGGGENKPMRRQDVEEKTTAAVQSLLGIDVFRNALSRVRSAGETFGKEATKVIGDADLDRMQKDLNGLRAQATEVAVKLESDRTSLDDVNDRLERARDNLEAEVRGIGAKGDLDRRLEDSRRERTRLTTLRKSTVGLLAGLLESEQLHETLCVAHIARAGEYLKPLYDTGQIPLKHVAYVRDLLERGTCVCGEDLEGEGRHRRHVEQQIEMAATQEERANYLGQLYQVVAAMSPGASAQGDWMAQRRSLSARLTDVDKDLSAVGLDEREINKKLETIDDDKIQLIRDEIGSLTTLANNLTRAVALGDGDEKDFSSRIDSLHKTIGQRHRQERAAEDKRSAERMAFLVEDVLKSAYDIIQLEQVEELSGQMNRLFQQMAANASDDDLDEWQQDKATLRMITQVGLRPVADRPERFEIFAMNPRGRAMPPIEINGASRRVLALAFVLALCRESKTEAPLIADSLLNFMSGTVRRNTLAVTAENSSQPILLLTGADLEGREEQTIVDERAGATFTLTGQWDVVHDTGTGDVLNRSSEKLISLLCKCGPRQWCDVCERTGQAQTPGWSRRS